MGFDVDSIDTSAFLKHDGSVAMTGNLNLNHNWIRFVSQIENDNFINLYPTFLLNVQVQTPMEPAVDINNGVNMSDCNITNLADPRAGEPKDAATKAYVDP